MKLPKFLILLLYYLKDIIINHHYKEFPHLNLARLGSLQRYYIISVLSPAGFVVGK